MRKMKDSGVEWSEKIPVGWSVKPLKHISVCNSSVLPENTDGSTEIRYIDIGSVEYGKGICNVQDFVFSEAPSRARRIVRTGDTIISTVRTYLKAIAYISEEYDKHICSTGFAVFTPNDAVDKAFFPYALLHEGFISDVERHSTGVNYPSITSGLLVNLKVVLPPLPEQRAIATFLDQKCTEIDALTADIQAQIETFEQYKRSVITEAVTKGLNPDAAMKDSGVEWVGEIPAHWDVIRGKYVLRYMQKPVKESDDVITCFRNGEVTLRSNRREDGFTMSDKEIGYQAIDVGDLVVHGMDGFAGAIGISDSRGKASPVLNVLDADQNKKYIMYYLRSMAYSDVFLALATGIRVRSCDLRWNKLAELIYPVPSIDEQTAIVKHIDETLVRANTIIADKKAQLETLDSYKKSLIYEYVTGKKEVPA